MVKYKYNQKLMLNNNGCSRFELSDSVSNDHLRHKDLERELTKYVEEVEKAGHSFIHMFLPPQSPTAS